MAYPQTVVDVRTPVARWARWRDNFAGRHGPTEWSVRDGALIGRATDGAVVETRLPFARAYDGVPDPDAFAAAAVAPENWGLLLVRKGGFAIAGLAGDRLVSSKVGRRHVQGRTKAGGQSQQRFARRRDNQARSAFLAATDHAVRIWAAQSPPGPLRLPIVTGGDRQAVAEVLTDPRLAGLEPVGPWLAVPDPRRDVLDQALAEAQSLLLHIEEPAAVVDS